MENRTEDQVTRFIILGFSCQKQTKAVLFAVLLVFYLVNLAANSLFILVTLLDTRLHSPMYFFLCNLSLLDLCFSSVSGPTVLEGLLIGRITISYSRCMTQMYMSLFLGQVECFLLAVMALDRYFAICNPLHYQQIMNLRVCVYLAITIWIAGILITLPSVVVLPLVHFCGHNIIDHTFCELQAVSRLTCMDNHYSDISIPVFALFGLVAPLFLILFTYFRIITTILRMPTAESRQRTFATCGSHLVVVTLFYGTAMVINLVPNSTAPIVNQKSISLFYALVVPALNPLIYTLRNKEVKGAVKKLHSRNRLWQ